MAEEERSLRSNMSQHFNGGHGNLEMEALLALHRAWKKLHVSVSRSLREGVRARMLRRRPPQQIQIPKNL